MDLSYKKNTFSFFTLELFVVPWGTRKSTCGGKIQKLVVSYRICFRWFQAFNLFPYRSQIFSTLELFLVPWGTRKSTSGRKKEWYHTESVSDDFEHNFFPYWMVKLVKPVFKSQLWDQTVKYSFFAKLVSLFLNQANLVNSISCNNIKLFSCY